MTVDLLDPEILRDIADKLWAAQKDMEEIKSRMKSTPASERTPEWQSENEKQMKACYERLDALGQRFSELNAALDSPEPGSRH